MNLSFNKSKRVINVLDLIMLTKTISNKVIETHCLSYI